MLDSSTYANIIRSKRPRFTEQSQTLETPVILHAKSLYINLSNIFVFKGKSNHSQFII